MHTHTTKEIRASLSPADALQILKEGNARFSGNRRANRNLTHSEWEQFFGDQPYQTTCPDVAGPAAE